METETLSSMSGLVTSMRRFSAMARRSSKTESGAVLSRTTTATISLVADSKDVLALSTPGALKTGVVDGRDRQFRVPRR